LERKAVPNGTLGDYPLTDILYHHAPVYSAEVDELIAELLELAPRETAETILTGCGVLWAPMHVTPLGASRSRVDVPPDQLNEVRIALEHQRDVPP
jgi:hypothetical protein